MNFKLQSKMMVNVVSNVMVFVVKIFSWHLLGRSSKFNTNADLCCTETSFLEEVLIWLKYNGEINKRGKRQT